MYSVISKQKFNTTMKAIDKTIKLSEQALVLKHKLKLGLWLEFHVFKRDTFELSELTKEEISILFLEFCDLYKEAFNRNPDYVTKYYPRKEQEAIWINQMKMQYNKRRSK